MAIRTAARIVTAPITIMTTWRGQSGVIIRRASVARR